MVAGNAFAHGFNSKAVDLLGEIFSVNNTLCLPERGPQRVMQPNEVMTFTKEVMGWRERLERKV